jgi:hypothetical protein
MAGAARDVASHSLGNFAVLQGQGIGGGMGIHRPVTTRLSREGDHQLDGIALGMGPSRWSMTDPYSLSMAGPRQTRRHHGLPQR